MPVRPPATDRETQTPSASAWWVYLLECAHRRLYTGITVDLDRRFQEHQNGKGAMFTRLNRPLRILATCRCADRSQASRLEARIKRLPAAQKWQLAARWAADPTGPDANEPSA
ncbi:MAG: GIY-YIG nuclease family protein [Acidiferrobacter sp.]